MNKTVIDLLKKYDDAVQEFRKFPKGRLATGPGKKLYDKMIAAKRAYEKAAGIQEPETETTSAGQRLAESFQKFLGVGEKGGLNVGPSTRAFIQEKAERAFQEKLWKKQDLDDLEDALQVQESKRFKGYKDPTITVPKRKEAVRLIESDPSISPGNLEKALQEQESKRFEGYSKTQEDTSPDFDRDKDIFHQIAYGISKLTGQEPSVTYDYPGELSVYDREVRDYGAKKKGGKVKKKSKKKYTSKKKYAMNRGGMASVRKPTRA
tara:strand:- start:112 stop:903 length:792 start_codon:yes stop_codon:yes gene_type:complete